MEIQEGIINYGIALYFYITLLSVIGFIIMGWDKNRAERRRGRTSENQLILIALLGGSVGIAIGMLVFKHKTSKKKFYIGIPGIYVLQWAVLFGVLYYAL